MKIDISKITPLEEVDGKKGIIGVSINLTDIIDSYQSLNCWVHVKCEDADPSLSQILKTSRTALRAVLSQALKNLEAES